MTHHINFEYLATNEFWRYLISAIKMHKHGYYTVKRCPDDLMYSAVEMPQLSSVIKAPNAFTGT